MGNNNTPAPENDARFLAYIIQVKKRKFEKEKLIFF
jgi:hypothetical protein